MSDSVTDVVPDSPYHLFVPSSMAYVSVRVTSNLTAMVVYDDTTQRCAGIGTDAIGADANMAASYTSVKVHVVSTLRAFVL